MKHIKPYNESNEYYNNINHHQYELVVYDEDEEYEKLEFTQPEIDLIRANLTEGYYIAIYTGRIDIRNKFQGSSIDIDKYDDEWFYVFICNTMGNSFYKCDGIQGVVKLIQDKI